MPRSIISALLIVIGALGLILLAGRTNAQSDSLHRISCDQSGDSVIVRFGMTKRPTNFGIETPKDRFLYLVDPAKGIDHLGTAYKRNTLVLKLDALQGTSLNHDTRTDTKVFAAPGQYTFRFQDANRAAYEDLHTLSCVLDIQPGQRQTTAPGRTAKFAHRGNRHSRGGLPTNRIFLPLQRW